MGNCVFIVFYVVAHNSSIATAVSTWSALYGAVAKINIQRVAVGCLRAAALNFGISMYCKNISVGLTCLRCAYITNFARTVMRSPYIGHRKNAKQYY